MSKRRKGIASAPKVVGDRLSPEIWMIVEETLQLSEALLRALADTPTQFQLRDVVLAALHRRALVTAASIAKLLREGVIDSSMVLSRTLLDIELTVKLIARADEPQRMAKRLAYYDYRQRQRHGQKQLGNPPTRGVLESYFDDKEYIRSAAKGWKEQLKAAFFDDVRDEVERDLTSQKGWHGKGTQEEAFAAIGATPDYFQSYSLQSMWVHGQNVESDMLEFNGKPILRPILTDKPEEIPAILGLAMIRLYSIMVEILGRMTLDPMVADSVLRERRSDVLRSFKARVLEQGHRINEIAGENETTQSRQTASKAVTSDVTSAETTDPSRPSSSL